jgi:nucleotide-binding universal stress UspA family protein
MIIPEIKKILYATDLSKNARYAFAYAVSLANLYDAKIILLHVLPEVPELVDKHVIG